MTKLIERVAWAKDNLPKVEPKYCIAWEDPDDIDASARITTPSPEWLASALHGGILPPVEVYHAIEDAIDENGRVTNGHLLHKKQIGPMSEEEAMEYLVQKDVPRRVWQRQHNRQMFYIVPRSAVPTDREFRNAWRLNND